MFNRGRNSDKLLEKHFGLSNLVSPVKKDTFDDSDSEEEKVEFDPPPEIQPDILSRTPIIRMTTPIKKKDKDASDAYYNDEPESEEDERDLMELPREKT